MQQNQLGESRVWDRSPTGHGDWLNNEYVFTVCEVASCLSDSELVNSELLTPDTDISTKTIS